MKKPALLSILGVAGVTAFTPLQGNATCQNLDGIDVPVGMMRKTLTNTNTSSAGTVTLFTKGFNNSDGRELNLGWAKTVGYLPTNAHFNATWAVSYNDADMAGQGVAGKPHCYNEHFQFTLSSTAGDDCSGSVLGGPWTVEYNVNTCGMGDAVFRGQLNLEHFYLGFSPSYLFRGRLVIDGMPAGEAADSACFKVSTAGGPSGCSD